MNDATPTCEVFVYSTAGELVGPRRLPRVVKSDEAWRSMLGAETYRITRCQGTERPFCGVFFDHKRDGVYVCTCCALPLFSSSAKFDSGTGWPSFFKPIARANVLRRVDFSHGMEREEIICARCDAHLGHVFDDGPAPSGERHCVNSESLRFVGDDALASIYEG
jgi:methionine-R-sulfoxide reductase